MMTSQHYDDIILACKKGVMPDGKKKQAMMEAIIEEMNEPLKIDWYDEMQGLFKHAGQEITCLVWKTLKRSC